MPGLVEADDDGHYVVKFRGAGQGPKALVAELLAGELARAAGFLVPEIVTIDLDPALAATEPDPDISDLLEASAGRNLGLDYLPGSATFDPVAGPAPDPLYASRLVLFDSFVTNVDRTLKNPNLLCWHKKIWLIDHGAALYFHHGWGPADVLVESADPFTFVKKHVLLPWAKELTAASEQLFEALTPELFRRVVEEIPAEWLLGSAFPDERAHREAYVSWFSSRRGAFPLFLEEATRARASIL